MNKEELENSKISDLSDTMFSMIEDLSKIEENIENILNEIDMLKKDISQKYTSIQHIKQSQDEMLSKINNNDISKITTKVIKLEENINKLLGNGMLEELSKNIDNKVILKKQATKWQMFMVGILVFLGLESIFFFIFIANSTMQTTLLIAFFISVLPFIVAMIFVQNNVKNIIAQEKAIPNYRKFTPRPNTPRLSPNIKDSDEVKNPFE